MVRFGMCLVVTVLAQAGLCAADDPAQPETGAASSNVNRPAAAAPTTIRLHLMEGSVVTGRLTVDAVTVETRFGKLEIPVASIVSFTPGLDSHPEERKKIGRLIQQLGANAAAERDAAQRSLSEMGRTIQSELVRFAQDEDAERRSRVQKILAELEENADEEDDFDSAAAQPWITDDTVETDLFTVVGKISPQAFTVETQFGSLHVSIAAIRRGERESDQKPEIRKTVTVSGTNLVQLNRLNSGVRVARGDKVSVTAEGKLVMSPWGNNVTSGPDGSEQFQWYLPNQIPGGALIAQIGTGGRTIKIGSKQSFTATKSGILYFAIAMNPQFASSDYSYPGEYTVKVKVSPK
jgi:hypothetical protein